MSLAASLSFNRRSRRCSSRSATSADPNSEWTTFMAHQAYPALMHMMLLGTTSSGDGWMNITIGDSVQIPAVVKFTAAPMLPLRSSLRTPTLSKARSAACIF